MEEKLAILMADLSGYTAMTEAHGPASAADLIDKYVSIVEMSLVGDSRLHERTGDEVMIISSSADDLLATALLIIQKTSSEHNFLQLHGGLHYGSVLKRKNSFFGTTINITSRIASSAGPGTFCFSGDFLKALKDFTVLPFISVGTFSFKNLSGEMELYSLSMLDKVSCYIDPVCKMLISDLESGKVHPDFPNLIFCSEDCLQTYITRKQSTLA